jgi:hypothetical protein
MKVCWPHAASYDFRTSGVKNISVSDMGYVIGKYTFGEWKKA